MMNRKILFEILNLGKDKCFFYFGDIGNDIYELASKIDINHPDLYSLELDKSFVGFLKLINLVEKNDKKICNFLSFLIFSNLEQKNYKLDYFTRFFKKEHRLKNRIVKKPFEFKSKSFYKFAEKYWFSTPNSFSIFEIESKEYIDEIKRNEKVLDCFESLNLNLFKEEVQDVNCFLDKKFNSFFDFKRITISNAFLIIAKINKLKFFNIENEKVLARKTKEKIEIFKPKITPVIDLDEKLLKFEIFEQLMNKPIFDNYISLQSGLQNDNKNVILGERDGLCYFLYYY